MRLLTLPEIAEVTRLPENTIRYLRADGQMPCLFRLGRRLVVDEADLMAWIETRRRADQDRHHPQGAA